MTRTHSSSSLSRLTAGSRVAGLSPDWNSNIAVLVAVLVGATALSVLSGYDAGPMSSDLAWSISPLGLLMDGGESLREYTSGRIEFTPGLHFDYLSVFLKTCILEAPFYLLASMLLKQRCWLPVLALLNLSTHPFVFFGFAYLFDMYLSSLLASEVFAAGFESLAIFGIAHLSRAGALRGVLAALILLLANLCSWQLGAFL